MSNAEIVRAWKDPEYRSLLSQAPPMPVGAIELDDPFLNENTSFSLAGRKGEHSTVFNCHTHSNCSNGCPTSEHCPHTGWQCKGVWIQID